MYWIMSQSQLASFSVLLQGILWCIGGWLLIQSLFRSPGKSILPGISLGLSMYLFFINLLARTGITTTGYWPAAILVLALGCLAAMLAKPAFPRLSMQDLLPLIWLAGLTLLITLIGRGLGIFDDRKNLSLISIMAAGDIPPRFYMNPDFHFSYHYGFQLLGSNLMHTGGFFPWSAFDLSKGFTAALAILMCWTWAKSFLQSRTSALWAAFLFTFASGARWLLLLAPQSFLRSAGEEITFWGTSAFSGDSLLEALTSSWSLQGGPPFPIPFAFNSGIFPPFILGAQAGPRSLGTITLFLVLLLIPSMKNWWSAALLGTVFALWGLAAEATFVLFGIGFIIYSLLMWIGTAPNTDPSTWRKFFGALAAGGLLSLVQGGTITEIALSILTSRGSEGASAAAEAGFSLHPVPAIISAHLGSLSITDPHQLLVGICEMGGALLLLPAVVILLRSWLKRGHIHTSVFAISSLVGILLPLFLSYDVERDITRLSTYGLIGCTLLALPALTSWTRKMQRDTAVIFLGGLTFLLTSGGLVIFGSLLTAVPAATFSQDIAPIDASMTRELWNELEPGSLVFDTHDWRSVVITGRLTRSSASSNVRLSDWEELAAHPNPETAARAGFSYMYLDDYAWQNMTRIERDSFTRPCVHLVLEKEDNCANCVRRLFDIRECQPEN